MLLFFLDLFADEYSLKREEMPKGVRFIRANPIASWASLSAALLPGSPQCLGPIGDGDEFRVFLTPWLNR